MLFGNYLFTCDFRDDAILPEYKGSTFRGVFGHALKRVVCALKRQDCRDCLLRSQCIYVFIFKPPPPAGKSAASSATPLHPYVIEPTADIRTQYKKGDSFDFHLLLFGRANDYLPYFIYAFDQIGQGGIGRKIDGKRPSFSLASVFAKGVPVYSNETGKINAGDYTERLPVTAATQDSATEVGHLGVHLLSPLRVKYENHLQADLPFHILVRAALRRISSLCIAFGGGEPDLDYRGLVARAYDVQTTVSDLRRFDWKRYSNRQDQSMLMGGITGQATYEGDLGEYLPVLRFCEKTHLGKQTTFGLGKILVDL